MNYDTNERNDATPALSALLINLLKKVLYRTDDEAQFGNLLRFENRVREYMSLLNLELVVDEQERYAYLKSPDDNEDAESESRIPRLVARRQLTYPVSLMLVLLRKKLLEFDKASEDTRLILSRDDIVDMVRVFMPDGSNEVLQIKHVEEAINKIVSLGFLQVLKSTGMQSANQSMYEVRRIIKSFVDAQWASDFDERLASYQSHLNGTLIDQEITTYE